MVLISLIGDVMLGRSFNDHIFNHKSLDYPWGNTINILKKSDIVIANLETTITNSNDKWINKTFNYKLLPKYAKSLQFANISYCSLANNHILDFNVIGMYDTFKNLDKLDIKYAGAGKNIYQAMKPVFITKNNTKIGFLSAADHYDYWKATIKSPGIWYIPIRDGNLMSWNPIFEYVRKIKQKCDILIFSLHWNYNYVDNIDPIFKNFGHSLIDNGVDIIHGHSPHHIIPIERYKTGIIMYSLGDFVDDYVIDKRYRNDISMIVNINLEDMELKIYPIQIKNMQVNLM